MGIGISENGNGTGVKSSVLVQDCVFVANTARCGGASYVLFMTGNYDDIINGDVILLIQWNPL